MLIVNSTTHFAAFFWVLLTFELPFCFRIWEFYAIAANSCASPTAAERDLLLHIVILYASCKLCCPFRCLILGFPYFRVAVCFRQMGSLRPPSSCASFLLPPLPHNWLSSSISDQLLTQALSLSTPDSSPSSLEASSPLHLQTQSKLSNAGSPLSCDSVFKGNPESPLNYFNGGVFEMSTTSPDLITDSCALPLDVHHEAAPKPKSRNVKSATPPLSSPSSALSSGEAAGAGVSKISKRRSRSRSRANKASPITVLSADASNFRAMVQQLTGIPLPQTYPHLLDTSGAKPTRLSPLDLHTLDTSSSFLAPKISPFLQIGQHALSGFLKPEFSPLHGKDKLFLGGCYYPSMTDYEALLSSASMATSPLDFLSNHNVDGSTAKGDSKHSSVATITKGREYCATKTALTSSISIENFLMDDEDQNPTMCSNRIDSLVAYDEGAIATTHSPGVDFTQISS